MGGLFPGSGPVAETLGRDALRKRSAWVREKVDGRQIDTHLEPIIDKLLHYLHILRARNEQNLLPVRVAKGAPVQCFGFAHDV